MQRPVSGRAQAERAWWARLTPDEKRRAHDEEAVREMASKITITYPKREHLPTPHEIERGKERIKEVFLDPLIEQAISIVLARRADPDEFEAQGTEHKCVICQQLIWEGNKVRPGFGGRLMHSRCVEEGQDRGDRVEKEAAFKAKYRELLAIRGEIPVPRAPLGQDEEQKVDDPSVFERALALPPGTVIPKPEAKGDFTVKGPGKRRREEALIYFVPNNKGGKPQEKGVNRSEFEAVAARLAETGSLTRAWFNEALPGCAKEGGCNFTTIGGLLELLGEAERGERGVYRRRDQ